MSDVKMSDPNDYYSDEDDDLDLDEDEDDVANNSSSIENKFNKAANYIQENHKKFSSNDLLKFYGFYKQSTCGPCNTSKPNIFNMQNRSKWEAWNNLGNLEKIKAMEMYIDKLEKLEPNWNLNSSTTENPKQQIRSQWVCTSIHARESNDDNISDENKTPFDYIKENNLDKLKSFVNDKNVNELKDENQMYLIHWAADRNTSEILNYLIQIGANINIQGIDKQTPLHYASSCGHFKCIQILIENNADKTITDADGQTCIDVAFDDTVKNFLLN